MQRIAVLFALLAVTGCGGMPTDSTNSTDLASVTDSTNTTNPVVLVDVVGACDTDHNDSQFPFGFDLPSEASLAEHDGNPETLLDAEWSVSFLNADVSFSTWVQDLPDSLSTVDSDVVLAGLVSVLRDGLGPD